MNMDQDPFGILEEKINSLMAAYDSLKKEKAAVEEQLATNRSALKTMEEKVSRLSHERETAREKVENLLGSLDRLIVSSH